MAASKHYKNRGFGNCWALLSVLGCKKLGQYHLKVNEWSTS